MRRLLAYGLLLLLAGCNDTMQHSATLEWAVINVKNSAADEIIIHDPKELEDITSYLSKTDWQPNTEPKMATHEDIILSLFIEVEQNMPERINEYQIWFEEDNSMTIMSNVKSEGFGKLQGKFGKPFKELLQQNIMGKDRVIDQHGQIENLELLHQFLKDTDEKRQASLELTRYTIEGAPIYWKVEYQEGQYNIEVDNREDNWGSKNIENYQCDKLTEDVTGSLTDYNFTSCEGGYEINLLSVTSE
ncbi:DUF4362 domain-containing protein [Solibacillus sp. FSL W7-1464]|uniref:DUF4362 domain-containing protein n=1 Tax=Solibacillus sp. FSL W7-1464 TaxID=2921706 RepID=UPI0030F5CCE7